MDHKIKNGAQPRGVCNILRRTAQFSQKVASIRGEHSLSGQPKYIRNGENDAIFKKKQTSYVHIYNVSTAYSVECCVLFHSVSVCWLVISLTVFCFCA